jgi:chromosome segregation ATPase
LVIASLVATAMLASCDTGPTPAELAARAENARLTGDLQGRDSLISEMTRSFDEIETNIRMMDDRGNILTSKTSEQELGADKKKKIVRDLQLMNGLMKESRERIKELTARLDRSKIDAKSLRNKLKSLDLQLAQRDSMITTMKDGLLARDFRIEQINSNLDSIEMVVAKREAVIDEQTTELNKAYYVMGTEKELEEQGVLTQDGGFIGIGKHASLNSDAVPSKFTQTDVRELHRINVQSKKAELVTEHPASSYSMVKENDMIAYLEIKDPEAFWKLSRYAVVKIK